MWTLEQSGYRHVGGLTAAAVSPLGLHAEGCRSGKEAVLALRHRLAELREQGFTNLTYLYNEEASANEIDGCYPAYDAVGIKSVLELSPITVRLENEGLGLEPDKRLIVSIWVRLIRTIDGSDLVYSYGEERSEFKMSLDRWISNGGEPFQKEVMNAPHRLTDRMIQEMDIQR